MSGSEQVLREAYFASANQTLWGKVQEEILKHVQHMHRITEQQRLWQVRFVKVAESCAKRRGLTGKKVKDLNAFVKDKNFEDLSISLSDDSIKIIRSNTSNEESDSNSCKPAHKK
eukprot:528232-Ditylum_brightwellii.AAC.1